MSESLRTARRLIEEVIARVESESASEAKHLRTIIATIEDPLECVHLSFANWCLQALGNGKEASAFDDLLESLKTLSEHAEKARRAAFMGRAHAWIKKAEGN